MSVRGYAKHRGCSHSTVAEAAKAGRLDGALVEQGGRRLIDAEKADRLWAATTRTKVDANGAAPGYQTHRAAREEAAAELTGLQAARVRLALNREQHATRGPTWGETFETLDLLERDLVARCVHWLRTAAMSYGEAAARQAGGSTLGWADHERQLALLEAALTELQVRRGVAIARGRLERQQAVEARQRENEQDRAARAGIGRRMSSRRK